MKVHLMFQLLTSVELLVSNIKISVVKLKYYCYTCNSANVIAIIKILPLYIYIIYIYIYIYIYNSNKITRYHTVHMYALYSFHCSCMQYTECPIRKITMHQCTQGACWHDHDSHGCI